jgi:hypothetical protein
MFHASHATGDASAPIKSIITATMGAALVCAAAITVNAQEVDPVPVHQPAKQGLVGSWVDTVTFPPEAGRPPLKSLVAFHDDGIMTYSDQGTVTVAPPAVFSSGRGVWTHVHKRTFAYSALGLISDLSGNLTGYLKTRGVYVLAPSGNDYSGTTIAELLDVDGNVLFSIQVSNHGRRILLELP